ncbi:MAG: TetR/AcrR family transcriptional regulator [Proteobacteria bacterium]|nr:TetR/AcrR family transcriptional regulator [Pseudomonadota bacterium]
MSQQPANERSGRERVLHEAMRLFADRGFSATSIQAIADAAGMAKPSLLHHFPSKDALRRAVVDELLSGWKEVLPRVLFAAATGKDRFEAVISEALGFFGQDSTRSRMLLREALDRPEELRQRLGEHVQPWLGLISDFIERGQASGHIHADVDPKAWLTEMVLLSTAHFAVSPVTDMVADDQGERWDQRRIKEFRRIAERSLYRQRREAKET